MAQTRTATRRRTGSTRQPAPDGSAKNALAGAAQRAKGPAVAGGAAVAGLAAGTLLGSKLAARAGRWVAEMQSDVWAVRAQAEQSRRQSPIEVVLSALTSRRLPRHSSDE